MTDLEPGIFSRVEPVHSTESLARRSTTEQVNLTLHWQSLTSNVRLFTLINKHSQFPYNKPSSQKNLPR